MNRTEAFKIAAAVVGMPVKRSTGFVAYVPYYEDKPHGPTTELHERPYWQMMAALRERKAEIAARLIADSEGMCPGDIGEFTALVDGMTHDWRAEVRKALAKAKVN